MELPLPGSLVWAHLLNSVIVVPMAGFLKVKNGFRDLLFLPVMVGVLCCSPPRQRSKVPPDGTEQPVTWETAAAILDSIQPPVFPDRTYSIKDFGAVADGLSDCTEAINNAINACHNDSGGRVIVPEGRYITGAVHLKSNVNLHLQKGAVLIFTGDRKKYLPMVHTRFEGMECMNYSPFIYAYKQKNIAITGEGMLNGQGQLWWSWKGPWGGQLDHKWQEGMPNQLGACNLLLQMVEENLPYQQRIFGEGYNL